MWRCNAQTLNEEQLIRRKWAFEGENLKRHVFKCMFQLDEELRDCIIGQYITNKSSLDYELCRLSIITQYRNLPFH